MFKAITKLLLISSLSILSTGILRAQAQDNSPFSQFGLGDFIENDMPSSHAMGGLSATYHDFFEANIDNPASLGFLQYTGLQVGLYMKRSRINRFEEKQTVWSGNLDHLSLNIPIINPLNEALERRETDFSWGTSFSLRPYTQVGYFNQIIDDVDSIGLVQRSFTGSGGLYNVNWGNGVKYKNFALGVNLGYLYGTEIFDGETTFLELENAYRNIFQSSNNYSGFQYRIGVLYEHPIDLKEARKKEDNPSKLLSVGLFVTGQSRLNTHTDITQLALNSNFIDVDTGLFIVDQLTYATLPVTWGAGFMYRRSADFRFGFDYQASSWSDYENPARPLEMRNSFRIGGGVAWIPDANSITNYLKRVEYRAGFYTMTDPRVIEGSQVKALAVTFGGGFPLILQRSIAWIQASIDVGRRTGGDNLRDSFARGKIGIILNDNSWFIKGKYN